MGNEKLAATREQLIESLNAQIRNAFKRAALIIVISLLAGGTLFYFGHASIVLMIALALGEFFGGLMFGDALAAAVLMHEKKHNVIVLEEAYSALIAAQICIDDQAQMIRQLDMILKERLAVDDAEMKKYENDLMRGTPPPKDPIKN